MNKRKVYTREFKQRAACMVIDHQCPVPDVYETPSTVAADTAAVTKTYSELTG
jgi:transposase-like protein